MKAFLIFLGIIATAGLALIIYTIWWSQRHFDPQG